MRSLMGFLTDVAFKVKATEELSKHIGESVNEDCDDDDSEGQRMIDREIANY